MAHTTFEQDIFIAAAPAIVHARLERLMTNIEELHPFILWTRHVETTSTPDGGRIDHYLVRDRMKLGPFTIRFTYKVDMTVATNGELLSNAYQSPGIHLADRTWCEPEENGTRVREHIDITAPRLLLKITYQGAAKAHREMFEKLRAELEKEQASAR